MGGKDPDVMIEEKCAITTRVAPSFLRIGHVDLFSRRVTVLPLPLFLPLTLETPFPPFPTSPRRPDLDFAQFACAWPLFP